jgi:hypothetical protein
MYLIYCNESDSFFIFVKIVHSLIAREIKWEKKLSALHQK